MTNCANCQYAEASYFCAAVGTVGEYRCGYCRTLARNVDEYRPLKPATSSGKPITWADLGGAEAALLGWANTFYVGAAPAPAPAPGGAYVAAVGDRVRVIEDWAKPAYNSSAPSLVRLEGTVLIVQTPMPPSVPGVVLPAACRYYEIREYILHTGWFVVERA